MRASFNVLDQAWIPVVRMDGREELLGIRETLDRAHELRELSSASPLEEYGLYRFLGLFLMDALRPESEEDIEDLLASGRFDRTAIEDYIALCRSEGVSFDLFDEERPFLQSRHDPAIDGEPKPVTVLDFTRASGNNHTHFDHAPGAAAAVSPDKAARLLPAFYCFVTMGGKGYSYSINKAPPYYGIIKGATLFQTVVNSLLPLDSIGIVLDEPPVLWRRKTPYRDEVAKVSWMQGMLFPARRICLIPTEEGAVSTVYFCQGENFVNKQSWRDPYVTYRVGKDGFFPMCPSADRAIWRNLCDIVNIPGKQASQLLTLSCRMNTSDDVDLTLYGVETSKASYLGIYRHSLKFPRALAENVNTVDALRFCISSAETLAWALRKALSQIEVLPESAVSLTVQQYYQNCEALFWQFCGKAAECKPGKEHIACFCDSLAKEAERAFSSALEKLNLRAAAMAAAEQQRHFLYKSIQKLKKEVRP